MSASLAFALVILSTGGVTSQASAGPASPGIEEPFSARSEATPTSEEASASSPEPELASGPSPCGWDTDCSDSQVCTDGHCAAPQGPVLVDGCTRDDQCKGDRICSEGRCTDPTGPAAEVPSMEWPAVQPAGTYPSDGSPPPRRPHPGWALKAGIVGVTTGAAAFGLTLYLELDEPANAIGGPIGSVAYLAVAGGVPVASIGARTATDGASVRGSLGLSVVSWVTYGLTMIDGILIMSAYVIPDRKVPQGLTLSMGALGLVAGGTMGAHAFIAHTQATRKQREFDGSSAMGRRQLRVGFNPVFSGRTLVGSTIGLRSRF